jgi:tetratricopeptide (TPR) repeat protein
MQGQLGKQLLADLIRDISRESATGALRITRGGDTIEVLFETGVPTAATSTFADEQIECRLVRDGLADAEQIKAAWLSARESSRTIESVMVESGALTTEALQQAQKALSLGIINMAFEWYTGDYEFVADGNARSRAPLTWTADECILNGARHASSSETVLNVVAPDHRIVCPPPEFARSMERSATLNSVEGYVLSCIQSPIPVWEATSITGLSHVETRRAIFVLILLGLLAVQQDPVDGASDRSDVQEQQTESKGPAEDPTMAVQWCPVEYASGEAETATSLPGPAEEPEQIGLEELTAAAASSGQATPETEDEALEDEDEATHERPFTLVPTPTVANPIGHRFSEALTGEEAVYQQRLFLEGRLAEAPAGGDSANVEQGNNVSKSLATAIQELNVRLRLAAASVPDQCLATRDQTLVDGNGQTISEGSSAIEELLRAEQRLGDRVVIGAEAALSLERAGEPDPDVEPESEQGLTPEETPTLQGPPMFEEPLRIGAQEQQSPASLPRRDNGGDQRFLKRVISKLNTRLAATALSDYYELLGVDRLASHGSITKSYEEMVALYDGYKERWPADRELESKIIELMSKIERAYETLGNVEKRRVYDMPRVKETPHATRNEELQTAQNKKTSYVHKRSPEAVDIERTNDATKPERDQKKPLPLPVPGGTSRSKRPAARPREAGGDEPDRRNPYEAAEEYYKRGRALYERSDLHTSAHLLREAIKLDPNRSTYHYQLGLVLSTLSQARKEHRHHKGCHVTCRLGGLLARNQRVRREAERHLLKAAELDPSNPEIKLKLGLLYKDAALDQKSQQYFYEALMLDASSELARLELGLDREPGTSVPIEPAKKGSRRKPKKR